MSDNGIDSGLNSDINGDSIWLQMRSEAAQLSADEPLLSEYYRQRVLCCDDFPAALALHIAAQLSDAADRPSLSQLATIFQQLLVACPDIAAAALTDIAAYFERDPACNNYCRPFLFFKGFIAVQAQRFSHALWQKKRCVLARHIQSRASQCYDVDIHPAARIGRGVMVDHATGLVIGETAVVGDNVSFLHGVTLGGVGWKAGQRHPRIGTGVLVSAGAKILGDISIGDGAKVGAGSVVLQSVPEHVTVAGVPARVVGRPDESLPALSMNQAIDH